MKPRDFVCASLLGAWVAVSPVMGAAAGPALPRVAGVVVDGDLGDWANRGLALPCLTPNSPRPPDAGVSHASARMGWDDDGLLVAVDVVDATPHEAHLPAGAYLADSVELFIAPDAARWESLQLVLSPGTTAAQPKPRGYVFDNRPAPLARLPRDVAWAVKPRAGGYTAEARLPWVTLGIAPAPGVAVCTRVFVNDADGLGRSTRFAWQPATLDGKFFSLTLADANRSSSVESSGVAAWTALDLEDTTRRLNLVTPAARAGEKWRVSQAGISLGELTLTANAPVARASLPLPAARASGPFTLTAVDGTVLSVRDSAAADAASAVVRANLGWRVSQADKTALTFARLEFPQHVFSGASFPSIAFIDAARVARLLGAAPSIVTRWLDASGRDVTAPVGPGLYAARTEVTLRGREKPLVVEHLFYRMPDGATTPAYDDETAARILGFGLQGADATPSHARRVAERWWHRVRREHGWSQALPYQIHLPSGGTDAPRPLIVHLHGTGQHGEADARRTLALLADLAGPEPIIVYPQSDHAWTGPEVSEVIDAVAAAHAVDRRRIYLMGFSMGGIGSWEVALDNPERFAAVAPVGGRMGSPADAARLRSVPLWVFNGEDDPTTTVEEALVMVNAVRRAGGQPAFTRLEGKSHGDSQETAYRYPGLFTWMLAQRLPAE